MTDKRDGVRARLGAGTLQHRLGEIHSGNLCPGGHQAERMAARSAADIGDRQTG